MENRRCRLQDDIDGVSIKSVFFLLESVETKRQSVGPHPHWTCYKSTERILYIPTRNRFPKFNSKPSIWHIHMGTVLFFFLLWFDSILRFRWFRMCSELRKRDHWYASRFLYLIHWFLVIFFFFFPKWHRENSVWFVPHSMWPNARILARKPQETGNWWCLNSFECFLFSMFSFDSTKLLLVCFGFVITNSIKCFRFRCNSSLDTSLSATHFSRSNFVWTL